MVSPIHNIEGLVGELSSGERSEWHSLNRLILFSRKLRNELVDDSKSIKLRKVLVDDIIRNKRSKSDLANLKLAIPGRELSFGRRDVGLVEKIVDLSKKNIGEEEKIRAEVKVLFSRISSVDDKKRLEKVFRHVSGEKVLDVKELDLELKSAKVFHLIPHFVEKKFELIRRQELLVRSGSLRELYNRIVDEEVVNNKLIFLVDEVVGLEREERKIEVEKRGVMSDISRPHTARNVSVLVIFVLLAVSFSFGGSNLFAKSSGSQSFVSGAKVLSSKDIGVANQFELDVSAKTELFNSLMRLYHYTKVNCVSVCVLDSSAIDSLLNTEGGIKKAALSASTISFEGNVLSVRSDKPLSANIPGSLKTAKIFLDNTNWRVSENEGNFEFTKISGKAWLTVNMFGSFGSALFKSKSEKISAMPDIKRALLFKYQRSDGSFGLYGVLYDSNGVVKNGIDLASEDFNSVNQIPYQTEEEVRLAFAKK